MRRLDSLIRRFIFWKDRYSSGFTYRQDCGTTKCGKRFLKVCKLAGFAYSQTSCNFQSIRNGPPRVIVVKISLIDACKFGYLVPYIFGRSMPHVADTKAASELPDWTGNVEKHTTVLHVWCDAPS